MQLKLFPNPFSNPKNKLMKILHKHNMNSKKSKFILDQVLTNFSNYQNINSLKMYIKYYKENIRTNPREQR